MTSLPMNRPRAGVIGLKGIGGVHVAELQENGVAVAAIASSSHDSAKLHASRLGIDRALPDAESLIADPATEVVHVCVPNGLHAEYSRFALEQGKHVVCEKPLATTVNAASELAELARDVHLRSGERRPDVHGSPTQDPRNSAEVKAAFRRMLAAIHAIVRGKRQHLPPPILKLAFEESRSSTRCSRGSVSGGGLTCGVSATSQQAAGPRRSQRALAWLQTFREAQLTDRIAERDFDR